MAIPIIRFEIEGMRHELSVALERHALAMDTEIQRALDAYCTEEHLSVVIHRLIEGELDRAIQVCVQDFFTKGAGRAQVAEAVLRKLGNPPPPSLPS